MSDPRPARSERDEWEKDWNWPMTPAEWAAQEDEDEGHRQSVEAERRSAQLLARSGRVPTGPTIVSYDAGGAEMTKEAFEARVREVGAVYRLDDGRRGLLIERTVWFIEGEDLELGAHIAYPDEPHWCCKYSYALVEATDDERQADSASGGDRKVSSAEQNSSGASNQGT